jgi:hypothetical protein
MTKEVLANSGTYSGRVVPKVTVARRFGNGDRMIRAIAIAGTTALAFGLNLSHGYWMPIAAIVAMKGSLDQTTITASQRRNYALYCVPAARRCLPCSECPRCLETSHGWS